MFRYFKTSILVIVVSLCLYSQQTCTADIPKKPFEIRITKTADDSTALVTKLFEAIYEGNADLVHALIYNNDVINKKLGWYEDTPLMAAIRVASRHVDLVEKKLFTDLVTARIALDNRVSIIKMILFAPGLDLSIENKNGQTASSIALQEGFLSIAELMASRHHIYQAIQGIGDATTQEFEQYKKSLASLQLPADTAQKIKDIIKRAESSTFTQEASRYRDHLKLIFDLPWNNQTSDTCSLESLKKTLNETHYGLDKIKDKILEFFAVRSLNPHSKSKILCLVGPPGVGKTTVAQSIAHGLNRKFVKKNVGGFYDAASVHGYDKAYLSAAPGCIMQGLKEAQVNNPVFLLDEIDKMGHSSYHGDPAAVLLEVLDLEQNKSFVDRYLELPFDLSQVLFIVTANSTANISRTLLDRMEVIYISSYSIEEKYNIAQDYLLPKAIADAGLTEKNFSLTENIIRKLITNYTYESGVRKLDESINKLCAQAAKAFIETGKLPVFTLDNLAIYLGPTWDQDAMEAPFISKPTIGIATSLYANDIEGGISFWEVTLSSGSGNLVITGLAGDTLRESITVVLSYLKEHAQQLGIDQTLLEKSTIHVHGTPGGMHKDGPSGGTALLSALASALTKRPFDVRYALTGELSLKGNVMVIGGLKEKLMAAKRHGIKKVIIPRNNMPELQECTELLADKKLEVIPVDTAQEVLNLVLLPAITDVP